KRKWKVGSFAALWISMSACIPTYMLASSLIGAGMNWWQAIVTIFLGNLIVLVPMILNAHAGTRYGIPFPVFCRASFGTRGANIPALMRAFVACGWFGIQTWIGGNAIYKIMSVFAPSLATGSTQNFLGITFVQFLCFMFFWGINMLVVYKGIDCIRWLLNIKAPLLIALGLMLLWWAYRNAGGFGPILAQPSAFAPGQPKAGQYFSFFVPALATNIAANVVSPANDFSHVAPHKISFRMGGLITGVVGIVMMPWKLVADPSGYIFTWLVGYSALLGPIGGIMIADYYVSRRR